MQPIRSDTVGGVNSFIEDQKKEEGEAHFTLIQFNDKYEQTVSAPLQDVKPLKNSDYRPTSMTALLDAVGRAIDETGLRLASMPEKDRPGQVIFVIMTDGYENSSTRFSSQRIKEMVEHQRNEYRWEFVFLGANQDSWFTAQQFSIQNAVNYQSTPDGVTRAFKAVAESMSEYRSRGDTNTVSFFSGKSDV
jgi:hypothetical protein